VRPEHIPPEAATRPGRLGDRREWEPGRWQVCLGACAHCGYPVWRFEGESRTDRPVAHKATCEQLLRKV
jgi:hypothetical protein